MSSDSHLRSHRWIPSIALAALLGISLGPGTALSAQPESPVTCDESQEPQTLIYGQHTLGCEFAQPTDLDRFVVNAEAGDTLRITLQTLTAGVDPVVDVRDPDGVVLATGSCNGHQGPYYAPDTRCAFLVDVAIATSGPHQLAAWEGGADRAGGYLLQVERVPPPSGLVTLPYNLSVFDETNPQTDRDCWTWEAATPTMVRFTLLSHQPGLDPEIEVRDPSGAVLAVQSCSGDTGPYYAPDVICSLTQDISPATTGPHTVCVRDSGADNIGAYELGLQCLFGSCPSPNRPPHLDAIGARSVDPGQALDIELSAQDPDGDTVLLSVTGAPPGSTFTDHGDGTAQFSWVPSSAGEIPMTFTVTDTGAPPLSAHEDVTVTVGPTNSAPVITPLAQQSVTVGQMLDVLVSATDGDAGALVFQAVVLPSGASLVDHQDGTASVVWSPTLDQVGNHSAAIQVSDAGVPVKTDVEVIAIRVLPPPVPESPVACSEAQEPLPLAYGQHATGCELAQATDLDRFVVDAEAGDTLRITVQSLTAGLDPQVEVRDPNGVVLATPWCNGHTGPYYAPDVRCAFLFDVPITTTGPHQLAASDVGANGTGGYVLQVERVPPPAGLVTLPYNLALVDETNPQTDRDCWTWQAAADTTVRFTLLSQQLGLDPELEVRDPSGAVLATIGCSGDTGPYYAPSVICSLTQDVSPTTTGPHTVCVRDSGADDVGVYQLDLQCLFGSCPAGPSGTTTTSTSTSSSTATHPTTTSTTSLGSTSTTSSSTSSSTTFDPSTTSTSNAPSTSTSSTAPPSSSTTTSTTPSSTTTTPPICGDGIIEADEECDPKAATNPCGGRCKSNCQCTGNCHDLPEAAVCDDLDACTDDDVCHARICGGDRKCRVDLPEESPVESKKPKVNVTIEGAPDARCKVSLFERGGAAPLASGAVDAGSDPLGGIANGRRLAKVGKGKIGPSGRLVVAVRLNRVAKRLLKGQPSIDAVAEIGIDEKAGKKRLLRQLITLVRP